MRQEPLRRLTKLMTSTGGMHGEAEPLRPEDIFVDHVDCRMIDESALHKRLGKQLRTAEEIAEPVKVAAQIEELQKLFGPNSCQVLLARMRLSTAHLRAGDGGAALAEQRAVGDLCDRAMFVSNDLRIAHAFALAKCLESTGDHAGQLLQIKRAETTIGKY